MSQLPFLSFYSLFCFIVLAVESNSFELLFFYIFTVFYRTIWYVAIAAASDLAANIAARSTKRNAEIAESLNKSSKDLSRTC